MKKTKVQQPAKGKRKLVKIQSKAAYELTMKEIDVLMKKGEANLSAMEIKKLKALATAAEAYEDAFQPQPTLGHHRQEMQVRQYGKHECQP